MGRAHKNLEVTKRQLAQTPSFLKLLEHMHFTSVTWSVERSATFLAQVYCASSCLQPHVVPVPRVVRKSDRRPSTNKPAQQSEQRALHAELVPNPALAEVQSQLNALIRSVINVACSVMPLRQSAEATAEDGSNDVHAVDVDYSSTLHRYIQASLLYRKAVRDLDKQLARSYRLFWPSG